MARNMVLTYLHLLDPEDLPLMPAQKRYPKLSSRCGNPIAKKMIYGNPISTEHVKTESSVIDAQDIPRLSNMIPHNLKV